MKQDFDKKRTFQLMVEASPNALILINKTGEIIYINQFTEKLFQYSKAELIGQKIENLIPTEYVKKHPANINKFMNNPKTRAMGVGRELFARRKDNTKFPAEIGLNPIQIENKIFVMATVINISERKKYENEILLRNEQLAKISEKLKNTITELEQKNSNIKESIDYAKKIQYSILPDIDEIKEQISQISIYYNPKDVIGGDFYWFRQTENITYLAAIDCTGHSVPGAMIAMVVYSLLNDVLNTSPKQTTGAILNSLHRELYIFLQQDKGEEYSQDGCDISLCKIDKKNNKLQFSGARQNLYLYDGKQTKIIKATSKSIGGYSLLGLKEPERNFKTENIKITENLLVALTTDGVLDQLNQNDEMFGNKNFINLIEKNYNNSNKETSENIEQTIEKWKKNTKQQDDMLTITFKI